MRVNYTRHNKAAPGGLRTQITAAPEFIREEKLDGKDFLVIPTVALKEGVVWPGNAPFPELALAVEFGRFNGVPWNGRPIVFRHPTIAERPVSAGSTPDLFSDETIGFVFNAFIENDSLKVEMWIDQAKLESSTDEELKAAITALRSGEVVEVSTGLFMDLEAVEGTFAGKDFSGIWRNVVPDHLAILPLGVIGACSAEMGCGAPRLNQGGKMAINPETGKECECGGTCETCAKPAEARLSSVQASEGRSSQKSTGLSRLPSSFMKLLSFRADRMSDNDRRKAIESAMRDSGESTFWIVAVFEDSFVFERGFDGDMFERKFNVSNGKVTFEGDSFPVRMEVDFVRTNAAATTDTTITTNEENANMADKKQKVDGLIANKATKFTDKDRAFLEGLTEEQLDLLDPVAEVPAPAGSQQTQTVQAPPANPSPAPQQAAPAAPAVNTSTIPPASPKVLTLEEYVAAAPAPVQEVLNEGLRMQKQRKAFLVDGLIANANNPFTKEQLEAKSLGELEQLAQLARVPSYEGRVGGTATVPAVNRSNDRFADPAPALFPKKAS